MDKISVYISSTFRDLKDIRKRIIERIVEKLHTHFSLMNIMEFMGDDSQNNAEIDVCTENVRKANVYILLVGERYGSHPEIYSDYNGIKISNSEKKSYTEIEYDFACHTLNTRLYQVHKLKINESFFTDSGISLESDLNDAEKKVSFDKFIEKLNETKDLTEINSKDDLDEKLNEIYTSAFFLLHEILTLPVQDSEFVGLDRKRQDEILAPHLDLNLLGSTSNVVCFLINSNGENDKFDKFSLKLRNKLVGDKTQQVIEHFDFEKLSNFLQKDDPQFFSNILLRNSVYNIFSAKNAMISFENLASEIRRSTIQSRVLAFKVDISIVEMAIAIKCLNYLQIFIKNLNNLFRQENLSINFHILFYILNPKSIDISPIRDLFNQIESEHYDLESLSKVEKEDVEQWLEQNIYKNDFSPYTKKMIFKQVFLDISPNSFPKTYFECNKLFEDRIKKI